MYCTVINSVEKYLLYTVDITITKTKASQGISLFPICDLCERNDAEQIRVKFFELPPLVKDILLPLRQVEESSTFQELWKQHGKKAQTARTNDEVQKRDLSISNVVESVWKPAYEAWIQLVASAMDGSLTLGSVDKFFEGYKSRKEDLLQELVCIFNLTGNETFTNEKELMATVEERTTQIEQYQQLNQYASAADTIWKFKEAMGFSGDFKVIEDLCNLVSILINKKKIPVKENRRKRVRKSPHYGTLSSRESFVVISFPVFSISRLVESIQSLVLLKPLREVYQQSISKITRILGRPSLYLIFSIEWPRTCPLDLVSVSILIKLFCF